jgi:hypothetical protein
MGNALWPVTLPQVLLVEGFSASPPQNFISTPMEVGPPKRRRRDVAAAYPVVGTIIVDRQQLGILWTFYRSVLKDGSLPFDWVDPMTRNACTYLFKEPFSITALAPRWKVSMALEAQP